MNFFVLKLMYFYFKNPNIWILLFNAFDAKMYRCLIPALYLGH